MLAAYLAAAKALAGSTRLQPTCVTLPHLSGPARIRCAGRRTAVEVDEPIHTGSGHATLRWMHPLSAQRQPFVSSKPAHHARDDHHLPPHMMMTACHACALQQRATATTVPTLHASCRNRHKKLVPLDFGFKEWHFLNPKPRGTKTTTSSWLVPISSPLTHVKGDEKNRSQPLFSRFVPFFWLVPF